MTDHVDRLHDALKVLVGHGHIKQRLTKAYEENLAEIEADELPVALQEPFADLRQEMQCVAPLNGEGPICASVRKMSPEQASACATRILELCRDMLMMSPEDVDVLPGKDVDDGPRVPPFLVKSV